MDWGIDAGGSIDWAGLSYTGAEAALVVGFAERFERELHVSGTRGAVAAAEFSWGALSTDGACQYFVSSKFGIISSGSLRDMSGERRRTCCLGRVRPPELVVLGSVAFEPFQKCPVSRGRLTHGAMRGSPNLLIEEIIQYVSASHLVVPIPGFVVLCLLARYSIIEIT